MTSARRVAYDLLCEVDEADAYANLILPKLLTAARLTPRDAGFATELGYGTLRMRGLLDAVIAQVSSRPLDQLDPPVKRLLELGAYQLLEMNVGAHAAVSETVDLARAVRSAGAAGFINAALRRISEQSRPKWVERVTSELPRNEALALRTSHPLWVVTELERSLARSGRIAELETTLDANNLAPVVNLVVLPGRTPASGTIGEPNRFSPVGARALSGNPARSTAQTGVRVQDEGSQLAALALSRVGPGRAGERWLDLCAGPGGKAALLAAEARSAGVEFVANEISPHRAELVRQALRQQHFDVVVVDGDGRDVGESGETFDRILLDAPCSGLGALRRRPEARWRKQPDDIGDLVQLQAELIDSAIAALAPGGVLAYVTCSPVLAETVAQIDRALASGQVELLDTATVLDTIALEPLDARVAFAGSEGSAVQLWPHRHESDAMFIALLRRV